jgi:hypothetical protein
VIVHRTMARLSLLQPFKYSLRLGDRRQNPAKPTATSVLW